jgi:hypothetical protein
MIHFNRLLCTKILRFIQKEHLNFWINLMIYVIFIAKIYLYLIILSLSMKKLQYNEINARRCLMNEHICILLF